MTTTTLTPMDSGIAPDAIAEIRSIYVATGGAALAPSVVDQARDPHSALHGYFEWDDTLAAEAHRLSQAENLIRRVKVTILPSGSSAPVQVRAYIATRELRDAATGLGDTAISGAPPGSYRALEDVKGTSAYEEAVLSNIQTDLIRLRHKYRLHEEAFKAAVRLIL
jgi:hypothetical protein